LARGEVWAPGATDLGIGDFQLVGDDLKDFVVVGAVVPKIGGADVTAALRRSGVSQAG
jgi:hypothetical protein